VLLALVAGVHAVVRWLPRPLARAMGAAGGVIACGLLGADRRRAERQLRRLPDAERPRPRDVFRHLGVCAADACTLPRGREELDRLVHIEGREFLEERLAAPEGTVWVTGHLGLWELPAVWAAAQGIPLFALFAPIHYRALDRWVRTLRQRHGLHVHPPDRRGLRRAVTILGEGGNVALFIDQRLRGRGTWVPFLGTPAWTTTSAARLAQATGARVALSHCVREPDGSYRVHFGPELDPGQGVDATTAEATRLLEVAVRAHPQQWVWMHDRWGATP
jgi:Kdo2-lipid IVA lauroyltransferase/acyltransferase